MTCSGRGKRTAYLTSRWVPGTLTGEEIRGEMRWAVSRPPWSERALRKILLVDDDLSLRRLVRLTLGPDYEILEANDGEEAVTIARRERPDLVFMDIRMPRLSGYEACRRIKESPETAHTKVVMLTANSRDEDRAQGEAVGADGYMTKPYSPLALLATVEELVGD